MYWLFDKQNLTQTWVFSTWLFKPSISPGEEKKHPLCKVMYNEISSCCPSKIHIKHGTWSKQGQIFTVNTFLPSSGSDASPSLHDQNLPHHQNFFGKTLHLLSPGLKAITGWSDLIWPYKVQLLINEFNCDETIDWLFNIMIKCSSTIGCSTKQLRFSTTDDKKVYTHLL